MRGSGPGRSLRSETTPRSWTATLAQRAWPSGDVTWPFRIRGLSVVIVWLSAANVLLFAFMAIVARLLEPGDYSLFAALFGLVALANVVFSGVQTAIAGAVAKMPDEERLDAVRAGAPAVLVASLVMLCCLFVLSPVVGSFLHTSSIDAVLAAACFASILLVWALLLGAFQGSMRFREFGLLTFAHAATRILAVAVVLIDRSPGAILWAVAISALPPIAWGAWLFLRNKVSGSGIITGAMRGIKLPDRHLGFAILVAVTVGFPSLGDVIFVRNVYGVGEAGIYAGLALTGRIVLFLALAVCTVLFPAFVASSPSERLGRLRSGVVTIVALTVPAALLMSAAPLTALTAVLGSGYAAAAPLVPYYAAGAVLFSIAAMYAYFHLATGDTSYLVVVVLPFLLLEIAAPFVVSSDISRLVVANAALAGAFALVSAAATHFRAAPEARVIG